MKTELMIHVYMYDTRTLNVYSTMACWTTLDNSLQCIADQQVLPSWATNCAHISPLECLVKHVDSGSKLVRHAMLLFYIM